MICENTLAISYYSSTLEGQVFVYRFWYYGKFFTLESSKPVSRGDIIKITKITDNKIFIDVIGDPATDELDEYLKAMYKELPVLLFIITKIPLSNYSMYYPVKIPEVDILVSDVSIKGYNKWYSAGVLLKSDYAEFSYEDKNSNDRFTWILKRNNK